MQTLKNIKMTRSGKRYSLMIILVALAFQVNSQTIFWTEDFNNGCTSNCTLVTYSGSNGNWTVTDVTTAGNVANEWFVSCAENGQVTGACGAGCGNNATLHIANVPCGLCLVCPNGDCGAAYNAGPSFGGQNPKANKRAESPLINCTGKSNITLGFKYIGRGQNCNTDYCDLEYSADGGLTWNALQTCLTSTVCGGGGQGRWTAFTISLPATADNNPTVKIGFRWANNSDGAGQDPSFAVDSISFSVPSTPAPVSDFSVSQNNICDSTCIDFTDLSSNSPVSWLWSFPGGLPSSSTLQNPTGICYNTAGVYPVSLTSSNAGGTDSITKTGFITVSICSTPTVAFSSDDSSFCGEHCFDFTDLSTNSPTAWSWSFPGATPDTSNDQNPQFICYHLPGSYTVTLVASNVNGSGTAVYNSFITIYNAPPTPTLSFSGDTMFSSVAYAYQWYYNGLAIPGATSQLYLPDSSGYYNVVISDVSGCTASSNLTFFSPTSISELFENGNITLFPNPVRDIFQISIYLNKIIPLKITLTDVYGRKIREIIPKVNLKMNSIIVDIAHLVQGTYLVQIDADNYKFMRKILKD